MKVPISWLKDFVDIDLPIHELAYKLTMAGLEVEEIHYVGLPMPGEEAQPQTELWIFDVASKGKVKVSSRGTKYLVSKGLDLSSALKKSAEKFGGNGGGHAVAAGATVPMDKEEEFLKSVDEIVGLQLR